MKSRRKNMSRLASLLLAVAMLVTSLPQSALSASAAEAGSVDITAEAAQESWPAGSEAAVDSSKEVSAAEDNAADSGKETPSEAAAGGEAQAAGEAAEESGKETPEGKTPGDAAAKTEGETTEDGKPADEGNKPADENDESDKPADEESEAPSDQEASDNTEGEGETGQDADLEAADEEEGLAGDEASLDADTIGGAEVEKGEDEPVFFKFYNSGNDKNYIVTALEGKEGEEKNEVDVTDSGIIVPYGSNDTIEFNVMPKEGYVITRVSYDIKYSSIRLRRVEADGGYKCTVTPRDMQKGYTNDFGYINIWIYTSEKNTYDLTFSYAEGGVEELVVTNGAAEQQVSSNVPVSVSNESSTSFKLKMKDGKAPAVVREYNDGYRDIRENLTCDLIDEGDERYGDGYYYYSLGKLLEDSNIAISVGWRVSFVYNEEEVDGLYRYRLMGDEADLGKEDEGAWFDEDSMIENKEAIVEKGEPLYFNFWRTEEYSGCIKSVADESGKTYEYFYYGEEGDTAVYKVVPEADMSLNLTVSPREIPVNYVDGSVKNISITSPEDDRVAYNAEEKKIAIYKDYFECNISFEVEEGKPLDRVVAVRRYYDYDEEYENGYYDEYDSIDVEQKDGVYSGSFTIEDSCIELRIVAGAAHTVSFEIADGIYVWDNKDNEITNGGTYSVTDGDEYRIFMYMNEEYVLATPYVTAKAEGEPPRELEIKRIDNGDIMYRVSVIPKADMKISISLFPESIPLKYTEGAIKDIEVKTAALSDDKKSIDIYNYNELNNCEISFSLEEGKAFTRAYYAYTVAVYDEEEGWEIGSKTYTESIQAAYDAATKSYTLSGIKINSDISETLKSVDYIQVVAGDKSEITFDTPAGKAEVYSFNEYKYDYNNAALTSPVTAVKGEEYLFGVKVSEDFDAAAAIVTAGDSEEKLERKIYTKHNMWDEDEYIAYYSYTPTEAAETLHVKLDPRVASVNYEKDAVESLKLVSSEAANKPEFEDDKVMIWSLNTPIKFELQLKSGKQLSRIFSSYAGEGGAAAGDIIEREIIPEFNEDNNCYEFTVDPFALLEIGIVTDKVNLADCVIELDMGKDEDGNYHTSYTAEAVEPTVTVTYEEEDGTKKTIAGGEYTVTYEENKNVGMALVNIKAKEGSGCTGSTVKQFLIDKAAAPTIENFKIFVDADGARADRELNLSAQFAIDTQLGEKGVKPARYTYTSCTKGGVLAADSEPEVEERTGYDKFDNEVVSYILKYSVKDDADNTSAKAEIALAAEFDNYDTASITIEVSVAQKTTLTLVAARPSSKKYDGVPFAYGVENVGVADENGNKFENADTILAGIRASLRFHYEGYIYAGKNMIQYDSYEAPLKAGEYNLTVELSDENENYKAQPYYVGTVLIYRRNITIKADPVEINVGASLPETYTYTVKGDALLEGDQMTSEPILSCAAQNTETAGQYRIGVNVDEIDIVNQAGESVRNNYSIDYENAWLTISAAQMDKAAAPQATIKVNNGEAVSAISKTVNKGDDVTIMLTADETDYSIYYTDDGKAPSSSSKKYPESGISINKIEKDTIIKAVTVKEGKQNSEVATITITVNADSENPENPDDHEKPDEPKASVEIKLEDCEVVVPSIIRKKAADPIKPETYVTYKGYRFIAGLDYSVSAPAGPDAEGFYTVTLTGLGRANDGRMEEAYQIAATDTRVEKFKVVNPPAKGDTSVVDISKAKLSLDASAKNAVYIGRAIEPKLDFSKDKTGLEAKIKDRINYAYKNNINAGKATVTISVAPAPADSTDTTVYAGSKTFTFNIKKAALNKNQAKATAKAVCEKPDDLNYKGNGEGIKLKSCKVTVGSDPDTVTLRENIDYTVTYKNNAKAGKATVTIKGIGNNVSGSFTDTYMITALDLSKLTIDAAEQKMYYSPKGAKLGTITAKNGGQSYTLKEGTDFTAKYTYDDKKAKAAGSGVSVKISGKNGCSGKNIDIQGKINILPADFAQCINVSTDVVLDKTIADKKDENKTKAALAKALAVTDTSGAKLKLGKGYKMTLGTDANTGNTVIDIEPAEENTNYVKDSKKTVTYRVATNLAKDKNFIIDKTKEKAKPLEYDGRNPVQITQGIIDEYISANYKLGENIKLVPGTYKNNTKKGTAQVKVEGIGSFYGTKVLKFKIVEK